VSSTERSNGRFERRIGDEGAADSRSKARLVQDARPSRDDRQVAANGASSWNPIRSTSFRDLRHAETR